MQEAMKKHAGVGEHGGGRKEGKMQGMRERGNQRRGRGTARTAKVVRETLASLEGMLESSEGGEGWR